MTPDRAAQVLGIGVDASREVIEHAFLRRAREAHPDAGGSAEAFREATEARDTLLPEVIIEQRFKPFVEDRLPQLSAGRLGLVAHPGDYPACPRGIEQPLTLAIGPEGGWIAYEVDKLVEAGLQPVQLGPRILRVETAVSALLGRLY